jgi:hypothetical protein
VCALFPSLFPVFCFFRGAILVRCRVDLRIESKGINLLCYEGGNRRKPQDLKLPVVRIASKQDYGAQNAGLLVIDRPNCEIIANDVLSWFFLQERPKVLA